MKFAIYRDRVTSRRYHRGAVYVVRRQMFPHTTATAAAPMVTRQGHRVLVAIWQGTEAAGGFAFRQYNRPDTDPARVYAGA